MPLRLQDLPLAARSMLLDGASEGIASALLDSASAHRFEAGSILFREGDRADCLYLIIDGLVGLGTTDRRGNHIIVEFVKPGQPFLIAALILDEPYLISATVLRSSRILIIPGAVFLRCVASDLAFSNAVNRLQSRLRRTFVMDVKSIVTKTAIERLAAFLLTLIDKPRGQATVTLPCERQVLASWLGILPSSMSRVFRQMEEFGVEGRGRDLTIRSVERLRQVRSSGGAADNGRTSPSPNGVTGR